MKRSAISTTKQLVRKTSLKAYKGLTQTAPRSRSLGIRTTTPLTIDDNRPSVKRKKAINKDPRRLIAQAAKFHIGVFARFGPRCYWYGLCGDPRDSDDAAHIIAKSTLGRYRYADVEFARPAHRGCHENQTNAVAGYFWKTADLLAAKLAHNAIPGVRVPLTAQGYSKEK
jgi:hypothetical protein